MSSNRHNTETKGVFGNSHSNGAIENNEEIRCMGCMEMYSKEFELCPHCGYVKGSDVENALHMYPGTMLANKYLVGRVVGYGGFGVTYIAWDTMLHQKVAIKEYLPSEFSTRAAGQTRITVFSGDKTVQFRDGMSKFVDEARRLAKFHAESGIVKIYDSFEENNTAYIVMEYLEGETLSAYLEREKTVPADKAVEMMMPVIESLSHVHEEGIIHRDIAPDNIFLTKDGQVKLIDFGAARYATTTRSRSLTVIVKPGYSAEEQYRSRGEQGSHTDVYSVGAVLYKMITGETPPDALERRAYFEKSHKDILVPVNKLTKEISKNQENAVYNALNVRIEDRTPDMVTLAGELLSEEPVKKRRGGIKKIDVLTWPLWAKAGVPAAIVVVVTLSVLLGMGVIGPKSTLRKNMFIPDGQTLVPDIVAANLTDAEAVLEKNELKCVIANKEENDVIEKNKILLQDPDAGNIVDIGTIINTTISAGRGDEYIPDVVGLALEIAREQLEALGYVVDVKEENSMIVAPGAVISQDTEAGQLLEIGSTVVIAVSKGSKDIDTSQVVKIPNITGMDYDAAKKMLSKYKLYVEISENVYSDSIPVNQIVNQYPPASESGHAGDTVTVSVCKGSKKVNVPDVVYRQETTAIEMLKEKGITAECVYMPNEKVAEGVVFAQSIKAGSEVSAGSSIKLTVSSGYKVTVPDVSGKAYDVAQKELANAGLASKITYKENDKVPKDTVVSQSLKPGEKVEQGTSVELVVSSGTEVVETTVNKSLQSISITSMPEKTNYYIGDAFDKAGLKVEASYADGHKSDVTAKCEISGFSSEISGSSTVKCIYKEDRIEMSATFTVKVEVPEITISETSISMEVGTTNNLTAKGVPVTSVSWSSDTPSVANVSDGKITAVTKGTAIITAAMKYGEKTYSQSCTVTVFEYVYKVTYNANGGKCETSEQNIVKGGSPSLPTAEKSSSVSLDANSGSCSSSSVTATCNFNGWYTTASGGDKITSSTRVMGDVTYYAQFAQPKLGSLPSATKTGSVSVNANGGNCSTSSVTTTIAFNGWYTSSSGGSKVSDGSPIDANVKTIYAQYAQPKLGSLPSATKTVSITLNATGGNCSESTVSGNRAFSGWYTSASGGSKVSDGSSIDENVKTIYAQYDNPTVESLPNATRDYYSFSGWFTELNGGIRATASTNIPIESNQKLYAHWEETKESTSPSLSGWECYGSYVTWSGVETPYDSEQTTSGTLRYKRTASEQYTVLVRWYNPSTGDMVDSEARATAGYERSEARVPTSTLVPAATPRWASDHWYSTYYDWTQSNGNDNYPFVKRGTFPKNTYYYEKGTQYYKFKKTVYNDYDP